MQAPAWDEANGPDKERASSRCRWDTRDCQMVLRPKYRPGSDPGRRPGLVWHPNQPGKRKRPETTDRADRSEAGTIPFATRWFDRGRPRDAHLMRPEAVPKNSGLVASGVFLQAERSAESVVSGRFRFPFFWVLRWHRSRSKRRSIV